jgi:DNA-binding NarL/FixJ family response regulator
MKHLSVSESGCDAPAPCAVVIGGRDEVDTGVVLALAEAGFRPCPEPRAVEHGLAAGAAVVVVAGDAPADARIEAIAAAVSRHPGVPLLATMPADAGGVLLRKALHAGAAGVILDVDVERALGVTARCVAAGQVVVTPALARRIAPRVLSHREREILSLVAVGLTNRQIATRLFVAESTVKSHLSSSLQKLDVGSRAEAAALLLDPDEGLALGGPMVDLAETAGPDAQKIGAPTNVG